MTKKNNVDVEFDSDVGYPYHLQPDIIKWRCLFTTQQVNRKK